jgi:hypothetical protein
MTCTRRQEPISFDKRHGNRQIFHCSFKLTQFLVRIRPFQVRLGTALSTTESNKENCKIKVARIKVQGRESNFVPGIDDHELCVNSYDLIPILAIRCVKCRVKQFVFAPILQAVALSRIEACTCPNTHTHTHATPRNSVTTKLSNRKDKTRTGQIAAPTVTAATAAAADTTAATATADTTAAAATADTTAAAATADTTAEVTIATRTASAILTAT